jgi:hypothetical protein
MRFLGRTALRINQAERNTPMSATTRPRQGLTIGILLLVCLSVFLYAGCGTEESTTAQSSETTGSLSTGSTSTSLADNQVITLSSEPKTFLLDPVQATDLSEAVIVGHVKEVLPIRENPLASEAANPVEGSEPPAPVLYKGYVVEVERAYGATPVNPTITVYTMGSGAWTRDGVTYTVDVEYGCDLEVGDAIVAPVTKSNYYDTPELKGDEYWFVASFAVFRISDGVADRVTKSIYQFAAAEKASNRYNLSDLESIAKNAKGVAEVK